MILFATDATVRSLVYPHYISLLSEREVHIDSYPLPGLVDAIESSEYSMIDEIVAYAIHKV